MKVHANAALGPAGRLALVQAIESGMTQKAAAAAFCVAPATAHRWWHRWRLASEARAPLWRAGCGIAPRAPIASRGGSAPPKRSRSCGRAGRPTSAPGAWRGSAGGRARRSGRCSTATASPSAARAARETYRRYEWSRPGALLHVDVARLARFKRPGHAVTGVRDMTGAEKRRRGRLRLPALRDRRPLPLRLRRAAPPTRAGTPPPRSWAGRSSTSPPWA